MRALRDSNPQPYSTRKKYQKILRAPRDSNYIPINIPDQLRLKIKATHPSTSVLQLCSSRRTARYHCAKHPRVRVVKFKLRLNFGESSIAFSKIRLFHYIRPFQILRIKFTSEPLFSSQPNSLHVILLYAIKKDFTSRLHYANSMISLGE
jgi:hypothetical protein